MSWKTWMPMALAIVLGCVAAKVGRDVMSRHKVAIVPQSKTIQVVVAKLDLDPGHTITEQDVLIGGVLKDALPAGSSEKLQDAVGRVVLSPVVKGQVLLASMLAPDGSGAGAQAVIPVGMRAVTIEINEVSGVAGLLQPGSIVDVVSTMQDTKAGAAVTRTIVQRVKVMAIGQRLGNAPAASSDPNAVATARSVTLLVKPREAETIELATNAGRARLVLRSALDQQPVSGEGLTVAELLGRKPENVEPVRIGTAPPVQPVNVAVVPPVKVPKKRTVEIIIGGQVSKTEFILPDNDSAITNQKLEEKPIDR